MVERGCCKKRKLTLAMTSQILHWLKRQQSDLHSVLEEIDVISSSRELFASTVINDTVSYIILNSFVNDYLAFAVSRYSPSVAAAGGSTSAGDDPTSTSDFSWTGDSTSAADSTSPVV